MTPNDLPPLSGWNFESESPEELERLNQIERRLKTARPTPVHFDAAAWERMVSASESSTIPESETVPLTRPFDRRRLSRAAGTIAAVWICGVVVGSGTMYSIMNHEPEIAQSDKSPAPVALASQEFERQEPEPQNLASSPVSPEIDSQPIDRFSTSRRASFAIRSTTWLDAPVFGLEEPLRPFGNAWAPPPLSDSRTSAPLDQELLQQSDSQRQLASSFVPPPKVTPRRILEELISDGMAFGHPL